MNYLEKLILEQLMDDINIHDAYELFKNEYEKSTGVSWSKDKFLQRAENWTFYGDESGYIAVRKQASGYIKLVGAAGSAKGKLKGFNEIIRQNQPIWGVVSSDIKSIALKKGLISPPPFVIKTMIKLIPSSVFGGINPSVNNDGSINISYSDVGDMKKYFIANDIYFKQLLESENIKIPKLIKATILKLI